MIKWEKEILGPIMDTQGMEQGGCASDKIYRQLQLQTAQQSELGVDLGQVITAEGDHIRQVLSAAGLADDVVLLSSSVKSPKILLHLTKLYCYKFQVKLVWSKTKLLVFTTKKTEMQAKVELASTQLSVDDHDFFPPPKQSMLVLSEASQTPPS